MIEIVNKIAPELGVAPACAAIGLPRATYYRSRYGEVSGPKPRRKKPERALSDAERQAVLDVLHEERFVDLPPAEIYGQLLSEGRYLCSIRTMYRILADNDEVRERRSQRTHPLNAKPELCATAPNQVWTWDITKLLGPKKWTYFYLYVVLDLFSRYVVGWLIADLESATLAGRLLTVTRERGIPTNNSSALPIRPAPQEPTEVRVPAPNQKRMGLARRSEPQTKQTQTSWLR
jgi:putative transposase